VILPLDCHECMCGAMDVNMIMAKADERDARQAVHHRSQATRAHRLLERKGGPCNIGDELQHHNSLEMMYRHAVPFRSSKLVSRSYRGHLLMKCPILAFSRCAFAIPSKPQLDVAIHIITVSTALSSHL